ncbi:MAG: hypothetical protein NZM06_01520 [Chloroherpetonaceae bacterium]|nr:hypothetical protein [Chloroherpetonaceae bacterium]MDW8436657.1 pectate lyase [Chloroherpetonaceae bacterium]
METDLISERLFRLQRYIERESYRGYDPYDALTSPIFRLPILNRNKALRWGFQQVLKRLPVNIRPWLGISKGYNPVTLGLCLQGYAYLSRLRPDENYGMKFDFLLRELERLKSEGYSGACWGYDFDWEARYARIPAFAPTVVATGFITNALFGYYQITGCQKAFALCESATRFVLNDLNKTYEGDVFCYSYSPLDRQVVLNATMKGARLLAQVYSVTKDDRLIREARKTVEFVVRKQQPNGAWAYATKKGDARTWADNFHTGYVLDCLDDYQKHSGDRSFSEALEKGLRYYEENFFERGEIPKYYDKNLYPIDATAIAQSILTLTRFGKMELATRVVNWALNNMQDESGYIYYQRGKYGLNRIPYMRWSSAWMFAALSFFLFHS